MQNNFYTTIEINNKQYCGKIFRSSNNELIYTTPLYHTQTKAVEEVRKYLAQMSKSPTTSTAPITNTVEYKSVPVNTSRRCCGR